LELSEFGLGESDLDRTFDTTIFFGLRATLRELLDAFARDLCRTIASSTCTSDTRRAPRLQERMDRARNQPNSKGGKLRILMSCTSPSCSSASCTPVTWPETILAGRFETLIPLLDAVAEKAPEQGVREIVVGMAHRGRSCASNILASLTRSLLGVEDNFLPNSVDGTGTSSTTSGFRLPGLRRRGLPLT